MLSRSGRLALLTAGFLLFLGLGPAFALSSAWQSNDQGRLRLIAAQDSLNAEGGARLGLQIELAEGWKTYWRSPGDAGYPVQVDWQASANVAALEMDWPVPHRFSLFGLDTFGYSEEVVFPLALEAKDPAKPATLFLAVDYLVCSEICVPQKAQLLLTLNPSGAQSDGSEQIADFAHLIGRFAAKVPQAPEASDLAILSARVQEAGEGLTLLVEARSSRGFDKPDLLVEPDLPFRFAAPEVSLSDAGRHALLRLAVEPGPGAPEQFEVLPAALTLIDAERGVELRGDLVAGITGSDAPGAADPVGSLIGLQGQEIGQRSLLLVLGLALIGGFILNFMPCVLPVLSIKLLSVVKYAGLGKSGVGLSAGGGRLVRRSFLASAAGIIFSFWVLAGLAIALRSAGLAAGWGIQFQQPLFLAFMAVVVALFACNLFGLFDLHLPGWLANLLGRPRPEADPSLRSHFLTGAFATLLATPCSAPFLGTAVGFALSQGAVETLLVFTVLGIGLALPYLLVALQPRLAMSLPKPGLWMERLRQLLGLVLAGTAAWLLTVLSVQDGPLTATVIGLALILMALALYTAKRKARLQVLAAPVVAGLALLALMLSVNPLDAPEAAGAGRDQAGEEEAWRPLDEAAIPALVAEGKLVFVDITADWCITCQVNKRLVLDSAEVQQAFADERVVLMRGDWTSPDPAISRFLERFGRYGIPFNALFGPQSPAGQPLSELLTKDAVLSSLSDARSLARDRAQAEEGS